MNARLILLTALLVTLPLLAEAQTAAPKAKTPAAAPAQAKPAPTPAPAPAPSVAPIGEVALVTGSVTAAAAAGQARSLGKNDPIYEGQTITVGPNSYASLKFADGGRVLLRPDTEFAVESYRFAPRPAAAPAAPAAAPLPPAATGSAFFRLVRGGFRAITGLIGKADQQAYRVTTPAATIGIRGTDYEVQTCSGDCPSQAQAVAGGTELAANSLAGLELAQAGGGAGSGIIVATHAGSIVLRTSRGETVVDVGQVALALASGQTLMLPAVPDALLPYSTASPEACE